MFSANTWRRATAPRSSSVLWIALTAALVLVGGPHGLGQSAETQATEAKTPGVAKSAPVTPAPSVERSASAQRAWSRLRAQHGESPNARWDTTSGLVRSMSGGQTRAYGAGRRVAAESFLREYRDLFLPPNRAGAKASTNLLYVAEAATPGGTVVTFRQTINGIKVAHGRLVVLVSAEGRILHAASSTTAHTDLLTVADLTAEQAAAMVSNEVASQGAFVIEGVPQLVIWPNRQEAKLAYEIHGSLNQSWNLWRYYVDAHTGEVLASQRLVLNKKPETADESALEVEPETGDENDGQAADDGDVSGNGPELRTKKGRTGPRLGEDVEKRTPSNTPAPKHGVKKEKSAPTGNADASAGDVSEKEYGVTEEAKAKREVQQ